MITRSHSQQATAVEPDDRAAETAELLRRARAASASERRRCLQQVVLLHLDLAESLARRYHGRGIEPADLDQVARLALVEAVSRADADRGEFLPYAVSTIRGRLKRYFRDHGWMIRPPRRVQELQVKIVDTWGTLSQQRGETPTIEQLAQSLGETPAHVAEACKAGTCFHPSSLDAPRPGLEPEATLGAVLGWTDPGYDRIEWTSTLRAACASLPPEDQRVLQLRFFEQKTQQEIADEFGVSQMQISRSLRRILTGLREQLDHSAEDGRRPELVAA